jgi:hypothetical protein
MFRESGRTVDAAMLGSVALAAVFLALCWAFVAWVRDRERERSAELGVELMHKLLRCPTDAGHLVEELRRSGTVRVPRVLRVLGELERSGFVVARWQETREGRPFRTYSVSGAAQRARGSLEPALVERG